MDEVYIWSRVHLSEGQTLATDGINKDREANAQDNSNGNGMGNGNGHTHHTSQFDRRGTRSRIKAQRRQWTVSIKVQGRTEARKRILQDPFDEDEYRTVFENYLRESDRPQWSPQSLAGDSDYEFTRTEDRIQQYAENLVDQLDFDPDAFSPTATECQIYVIEQHRSDGPGNDAVAAAAAAAQSPDIHCLAWELLENVSIPLIPHMRLRVTRVSDFHTFAYGHRPYRILQPLSAVQADTTKAFKILLVIARDFSRAGAERDPEPDLAQWPLMTMQKKLRSRLLLEVVRPGSVEELGMHLRFRESQGMRFNLVHFDLHGKITKDSHGDEVPGLLFAGHAPAIRSQGYQLPQTQLARAEVVAELLAEHKIENVVLNACLSAYNRSGSSTNLAHIFLKHGIRRVSAMWFYVHWQTVSTYLEAFYHELLVKGVDFNTAANRGRKAIRQKPTSRTGQEYQDFFLCVNYASEVSRPQSVQREPSPSPSIRSQDSSTSNNSVKSFKAGLFKQSSPRLGDNFIIGDEPIMRLKLHFLELEYKLMTCRIVYASDLRREDSKLQSNVEKLVNMWLATNLIDDVFYYRGKDFAKRRVLKETVPHREKRSRASSGGYLQLLFPRPVKSLRQSLHIIRDLDAVVDPGMQADELENQRSEERRMIAQENLQRFAAKVYKSVAGSGVDEGMGGGGKEFGSVTNVMGGSYVLILGSNDAQWWKTYLQHLGGEWWVHMPWGFTLHSRHRGPGTGMGRRGPGVRMLGIP